MTAMFVACALINASVILFTKIAPYPAAISSGLPADVV
jgi:hypothetical protein